MPSDRIRISDDVPLKAPFFSDEADAARRPIASVWERFFQRLARTGAKTLSGLHANRGEPDRYPTGSTYREGDRGGVVYQNRERTWFTTVDADSAINTTTLNIDDTTGYSVGDKVLIGEGTSREETRFVDAVTAGVSLTLTNKLGFTHTAADADSVIRLGSAWQYDTGVMRGTLNPNQKPADLGVNDTGFLFFATDYLHTYRWTGSAWELADKGDYSLRVVWSLVNPGAGWKLLDGTSNPVLYSTATGGVNAINLPDWMGKYVKGWTAYDLGNAAVAWAITGDTADESAHTHNVNAMNTGGPNATGATGAAGAVNEPTVTHVHQVPAHSTLAGSAHKHGKGTLAIDMSSGDLAHVKAMPFVRL